MEATKSTEPDDIIEVARHIDQYILEPEHRAYNMEKNDYIYIRAWHLMTGSYQYYIDMMVSKARQDDAPENAIYYSADSRRWMTVDDIASPKTKAEVTTFAERLRSV